MGEPDPKGIGGLLRPLCSPLAHVSQKQAWVRPATNHQQPPNPWSSPPHGAKVSVSPEALATFSLNLPYKLNVRCAASTPLTLAGIHSVPSCARLCARHSVGPGGAAMNQSLPSGDVQSAGGQGQTVSEGRFRRK